MRIGRLSTARAPLVRFVGRVAARKRRNPPADSRHGTSVGFASLNPPYTGMMMSVMAVMLAACGQDNHYIAPPPPQVTVAVPVSALVTRYRGATGHTADGNGGNVVAHVQAVGQ